MPIRISMFIALGIFSIAYVHAVNEELVPGPLLTERTELSKKIDEAQRDGVGVKAYRDVFNQIEKHVSDGSSAEQIESEVQDLSKKLKTQLDSQFDGLRSRGNLNSVTADISDPVWGPYVDEIDKHIYYSWRPQHALAHREIVLHFQVLKNGALGKTAIVKSSGDKAADLEAVAALKRASPFKPWPAQPKDNELNIEFHFGVEHSKQSKP